MAALIASRHSNCRSRATARLLWLGTRERDREREPEVIHAIYVAASAAYASTGYHKAHTHTHTHVHSHTQLHSNSFKYSFKGFNSCCSDDARVDVESHSVFYVWSLFTTRDITVFFFSLITCTHVENMRWINVARTWRYIVCTIIPKLMKNVYFSKARSMENCATGYV